MRDKTILSSMADSRRRELLELLLAEEGSGDSDCNTILARENQQEYPLSFAQERMWFLNQLTTESTMYGIFVVIRLEGLLDVSALQRSYDTLVRRHEGLRSSFPVVDDLPVQVILPPDHFDLGFIDLTELSEVQASLAQRTVITGNSQRPFDLSRGPLFRLTLLRVRPQEHVLLFNLHHIITDAWSMGIIMRELSECYSALVTGKIPTLAPQKIQYADYADWQRRSLQGERLDSLVSFWRQTLAGIPSALELPKDRARNMGTEVSGGVLRRKLPEYVAERLGAFCRKEQTTPFVALLAVFGVLLYRYTGQQDFLVGTSVANRDRVELEGLIGLFMNNLPLRIDASAEPSFRELLERVRHTSLAAYEHQELPYDLLIRALRKGDANTPLAYQVMFELERIADAPRLPGIQTSMLSSEDGIAKVELDVIAGVGARDLSLSFRYSAGFESKAIARWITHFETLLGAALDCPNAAISQMDLLSQGEREQIIFHWSGKESSGQPGDIRQLFEAQAASQRDSIAIGCGEDQITYGELGILASRTAFSLVRCGVAGDDLVAIIGNRGVEFWAAVLGIFAAGAVYLPIDPKLPSERLVRMLMNSHCAAVVISDKCPSSVRDDVEHVLQVHRVPVLTIEQCMSDELARSTSPRTISPESLAYAIFTSGSTGFPKLAMVEHRGFLNHLMAKITELEVTAHDVVAQNASQSFDISIWQIFAPLISGARVEVFDDESSRDASRIIERVRAAGVTILELVPAIATQVLEGLKRYGLASIGHLRRLIVTGEAVSPEFCREWLAAYPGVPLLNAYGPTECSDDVTHASIEVQGDHGMSSVCIGRAIMNTQLYVLDGVGNLLPQFVPGDLYIGGTAVGRGYYKDPMLTAERFVPDPFSSKPGNRMYCTGDRAKWQKDGSLQLLGRVDRQVKLRGFRIGLGEIEAELATHPGVRNALVMLRKDKSGNECLVGYVVQREPNVLAAADLRQFAEKRLPEYMVPSGFVFLTELPLTPNGKVDRQALPDQEYERQPSGQAPRTATEEVLAGIWQELLGWDKVAGEDDFFQLGGHSLLATRLVFRVREVFHAELPLTAVFEAPTLARLAERIDLARATGKTLPSRRVGRAVEDDPLPLSYAQQRLWFAEQWLRGTGLYSMPFAVRLRGALNVGALEGALAGVIRRHEVLRTVFVNKNGLPVQVIQSEGKTGLSVVDLRGCRDEVREAEAQRLATEEEARAFDLERGPLVRATLLRLQEKENILLFTMHHIISDEWSLGVLVREIGELYSGLREDREVRLPPLEIRYVDYAVWEREWLQGEALETQLRYWKNQLAGLEKLELMRDGRRVAARGNRGGSEPFALSQSMSLRLREFSRRQNVTLFMTLLAGFQALLARYTGQHDIAVGTDHAGRSRRELEGIVGFFVNQLVMRSNVSDDPNFRELLRRTRAIALEAYMHSDLPFEKLVQELRPDRDLSGQPLFQAKLVFLNTPSEKFSLPGITVEPVRTTGTRPAKFDLALVIEDSPTQLSGSLSFNRDLFSATSARRLTTQFATLLENVVSQPELRLSQIDLISEQERCFLDKRIQIDDLSTIVEI